MSPFFTPSNVKLPSISVTFPFVVPFTSTVAPVIGPKASSTTPLTFPLCWETLTLCFTGAISAKAPTGTAKAPDSKIRLTNLVFFSIKL